MLDARITRCMPTVEGHRERLAVLQGVWDSLSLLSHLSGDGLNMAGTRQAFQALACDLVASLGAETIKKTTLELKADAQVAVDIMVRNLFERTADIGFLCADDDIRQYLKDLPGLGEADEDRADSGLAARRRQLHLRFEEYVRKYSVYHNIILLQPDGRVALQLDRNNPVVHSSDPLIAETLATTAGYVETFRKTDLMPNEACSLVYSYRVCDGAQTLGVLCLCFRFDNEVESIFANLRDEHDWTVLALLDASGRVIGSSDPWQLPVGVPITLVFDEGGQVVRFAGREYLAITRRTQGYQGYSGPGWYGHAMVPLQHAFEETDTSAGGLEAIRGSTTIFAETLQEIPRRAETIQRELNRAVWNGNVRLGTRPGEGSAFSKVLLREIGNTGRKTKEEFERSIDNLHATVVSAILHDSRFFASLAVDILDRNLYERANDCRWWALNGTLVECLTGAQGGVERATGVLKQINSLYSVYHNLVLFDADRRVIAVSNPEYLSAIGSQIEEPWARETIGLADTQCYSESAFEPSRFYGDRHTLVYGAALRNARGRAIGGVGIVFDTAPQLQAMLQDALPRTDSGAALDGCIGLFVDRDGLVISATARYAPGDRIELDPALISCGREGAAKLVAFEGRWYAIGLRGTSGYREYAGLGAMGLVMIPLGAKSDANDNVQHPMQRSFARRSHGARQTVEIATFHVGSQWLGLFAEHVVEAIEPTGLRAAAGAGAGFAGYLMYQDNPLPVIDLGRVIGAATPAAGRRNVVVVRVGTPQRTFGLLVDELDDIPEVAADWIVPAPNDIGASIFADRMVRQDDAEGPLLFVLELEQVFKRVFGRRASENLNGTPAAAAANSANR
jgi:chemotaxis signal transduction protein